MTLEILHVLLRTSLTCSFAALAVLALRGPVARWCGAPAAYALWLAVPFATLGALLPARLLPAAATGGPAPVDLTPYAPTLLALWLGGAAIFLALAVIGQALFLRRAAQGVAGPAVVGVFAPRTVFPRDFANRFSDTERALIRLHERTHINGQDSRINALAVLFQALNWFNPIAYWAGERLRLDQEMACDARVVAARPSQRRAYAEALLKAQTLSPAPRLGCAWATSAHPLEHRVVSLARGPARASAASAGALIVGTAAVLAASLAWSLQPARQPPLPKPSIPLTILVDIVH
ncbi:MAG: hypothetical protein JWP92_1997 [Caulobacter sp.]|nr:hypothetical protein [Caulobacter sp.]